MRKLLALGVTFALSAGWLITIAGPAAAVCHTVSIEAAPNPVEEGVTNVTVTITRLIPPNTDGCTANINYTTSDGSAKEPDDYKRTFGHCSEFDPPDGAKKETCEFTVPIREDTIFEGNETFKVAFSGTSQSSVSGEVEVTIKDDDPSPPPAAPPPKASPAKSPSPSPSPSPAKSPSPTPSPSLSPSPSPSAVAAAKKSGPPTGLIIGIVALVIAGGAGAGLWYLRKNAAEAPEAP
jgi:hypothetical protein